MTNELNITIFMTLSLVPYGQNSHLTSLIDVLTPLFSQNKVNPINVLSKLVALEFKPLEKEIKLNICSLIFMQPHKIFNF